MQVDIPTPNFTHKPKPIRYVNVATQTDPCQVFPVPSQDIRSVILEEEAQRKKQIRAEKMKIFLEQRKKLAAHKQATIRADKIKKAQALVKESDKSYKIPKMNRTSGPPGASCKLTFPKGYFTNSPTVDISKLNITEKDDDYPSPPTPKIIDDSILDSDAEGQ